MCWVRALVVHSDSRQERALGFLCYLRKPPTHGRVLNRQLECGCVVGSLRKDFNEKESHSSFSSSNFPPFRRKLQAPSLGASWEKEFLHLSETLLLSSVFCYHALKLYPLLDSQQHRSASPVVPPQG